MLQFTAITYIKGFQLWQTLSESRCEDKCEFVERIQIQKNKTLEADMPGGPLPYTKLLPGSS
jgi:hypothetical protein